MPSDQFDFLMPRDGATGCRSISPGLVHCRQLILKLIEVICGNCLNAINNGSACSVLFLSTTGLFPALRKTLEHSGLTSFYIQMFKMNSKWHLKKFSDHVHNFAE